MWWISDYHHQPTQTVHYGNKYVIGNGIYGYRGTLDEARAEDQVGLNISNLYDGLPGKWRESVNAWNPFYTEVSVQGISLNISTQSPTNHHQKLSLKHGLHQRRTTYRINDKDITIESERFISMHAKNTMALRYTITASDTLDVEIKTGIDTLIWELNGPHFKEFEHLSANGIGITGSTQECKHQVTLLTKTTLDDTQVVKDDSIFGETKTIHLTKNESFHFTKIIILDVNKPLEQTQETLTNQFDKGYNALRKDHQHAWNALWAISDILIEGDDDAQHALRYSIYHLMILTPDKDKSIPARGLSGQVYKGAIFWDTEIFMLPFFLHTNPRAAKALIDYRIKTLPGAQAKAKHYGFEGAFYAWESHENGQDVCSDFNITDVFTNRDVRTYFKDKQIHISGDIVYAMWHYVNHTNDTSILLNGGADVIFEVARFYLSYLKYDFTTDVYEALDVVGPDEYHERVNNNAFTNKLIAYVFEIALKVASHLKTQSPTTYTKLNEHRKIDTILETITRVHTKLKAPTKTKSQVIEQFDGYFALEDTRVDVLKTRLVHPQEYWGTSHGVAYPTQIIKQADVVTMLSLFSSDYSTDIKQANYDYYHPRTEHGSSLSASMYGLLACDINRQDDAYDYFMKSASIDLTGKSKQFAGNTYIGGTHPAASGGAYMLALYGFAGLKTSNGTLSVQPRLPKHIKSMQFKLHYQEALYTVTITHNDTQIKKESTHE